MNEVCTFIHPVKFPKEKFREEYRALLAELAQQVAQEGHGFTAPPAHYPPPVVPKLVCGDVEIPLKMVFDMNRVPELKCVNAVDGECELMSDAANEIYIQTYAYAEMLVMGYLFHYRMRKDAYEKTLDKDGLKS